MSATSAASTTPEKDWSALAGEVLASTYRRPDEIFVSGEGSWLETAGGERYLDMTAGVAVNALGHGAPEIRQALVDGAAGLIHTSNLFHTRPAIQLAARLVAGSFAESAFFCNSGAEAVEGALKFARLAAGEGRSRILAFHGSFHGRTFGALACTDRPAYRRPFEPLMGGVDFAPYGEESSLEEVDRSTAAVLVEPIQGEGGIRVPPDGWLVALRERCDEVGALLIADEVQTGLGRTGTLWAHQQFGFEPDLMAVAKPLAGGLPMGAVLLGVRADRAVTPGCHASTFGGGPLVASVASRVLETVERPGFLERVRGMGRRARRKLAELGDGRIQEVRGRGLLLGVRVNRPAAEVVERARERRLLLVAAGDDVVRLLPRLNVSEEELDLAVQLLGEAME